MSTPGRSRLNKFQKKELVDKYKSTETTETPEPPKQPTQTVTRTSGRRGPEPTPPPQPVQEQQVATQAPPVEGKVSTQLVTGAEIKEDRIGVDDNDQYKEGWEGIVQGLTAPTEQLVQIPKDIYEGVPAENQRMKLSWLDLLITPALAPLGAAKELGLSQTAVDRGWYSPFGQVDIFGSQQNKALPGMFHDSGDKRGFFEGMHDNLSIIGETISNPEYGRIAVEGDETYQITGYTQAEQEFRKYPGYYMASVVGDIPYFVLAPTAAVKYGVSIPVKGAAIAIRAGTKAGLSLKYLQSASKLNSVAKNLQVSLRADLTTKKGLLKADKAAAAALKAIDTHAGIEISERKKDIAKIIKEKVGKGNVEQRKLDESAAKLQSEITEKQKAVNLVKAQFESSASELKRAEKAYSKTKSDADLRVLLRSRADHSKLIRRSVQDKIEVDIQGSNAKIKTDYNAFRQGKIRGLESKIDKLKKQKADYEARKQFVDSKSLDKQINRVQGRINRMEQKLVDTQDNIPKWERIARTVESAPEEAATRIKRPFRKGWSIDQDVPVKVEGIVQKLSYGVKKLYNRKEKQEAEFLSTHLRMKNFVLLTDVTDPSRGGVLLAKEAEATVRPKLQDLSKRMAEVKQEKEKLGISSQKDQVFSTQKLDMEYDDLIAEYNKILQENAVTPTGPLQELPILTKVGDDIVEGVTPDEFVYSVAKEQGVPQVKFVKPELPDVQVTKRTKGYMEAEIGFATEGADAPAIIKVVGVKRRKEYLKQQYSKDAVDDKKFDWEYHFAVAEDSPALHMSRGRRYAYAREGMLISPSDFKSVEEFDIFKRAYGLADSPELEVVGQRVKWRFSKDKRAKKGYRMRRDKEDVLEPMRWEGKVWIQFEPSYKKQIEVYEKSGGRKGGDVLLQPSGKYSGQGTSAPIKVADLVRNRNFARGINDDYYDFMIWKKKQDVKILEKAEEDKVVYQQEIISDIKRYGFARKKQKKMAKQAEEKQGLILNDESRTLWFEYKDIRQKGKGERMKLELELIDAERKVKYLEGTLDGDDIMVLKKQIQEARENLDTADVSPGSSMQTNIRIIEANIQKKGSKAQNDEIIDFNNLKEQIDKAVRSAREGTSEGTKTSMPREKVTSSDQIKAELEAIEILERKYERKIDLDKAVSSLDKRMGMDEGGLEYIPKKGGGTWKKSDDWGNPEERIFSQSNKFDLNSQMVLAYRDLRYLKEKQLARALVDEGKDVDEFVDVVSDFYNLERKGALATGKTIKVTKSQISNRLGQLRARVASLTSKKKSETKQTQARYKAFREAAKSGMTREHADIKYLARELEFKGDVRQEGFGRLITGKIKFKQGDLDRINRILFNKNPKKGPIGLKVQKANLNEQIQALQKQKAEFEDVAPIVKETAPAMMGQPRGFVLSATRRAIEGESKQVREVKGWQFDNGGVISLGSGLTDADQKIYQNIIVKGYDKIQKADKDRKKEFVEGKTPEELDAYFGEVGTSPVSGKQQFIGRDDIGIRDSPGEPVKLSKADANKILSTLTPEGRKEMKSILKRAEDYRQKNTIDMVFFYESRADFDSRINARMLSREEVLEVNFGKDAKLVEQTVLGVEKKLAVQPGVKEVIIDGKKVMVPKKGTVDKLRDFVSKKIPTGRYANTKVSIEKLENMVKRREKVTPIVDDEFMDYTVFKSGKNTPSMQISQQWEGRNISRILASDMETDIVGEISKGVKVRVFYEYATPVKGRETRGTSIVETVVGGNIEYAQGRISSIEGQYGKAIFDELTQGLSEAETLKVKANIVTQYLRNVKNDPDADVKKYMKNQDKWEDVLSNLDSRTIRTPTPFEKGWDVGARKGFVNLKAVPIVKDRLPSTMSVGQYMRERFVSGIYQVRRTRLNKWQSARTGERSKIGIPTEQDPMFPAEQNTLYRLERKRQLEELVKKDPFIVKQFDKEDKKLFNMGTRPASAEELADAKFDELVPPFIKDASGKTIENPARYNDDAMLAMMKKNKWTKRDIENAFGSEYMERKEIFESAKGGLKNIEDNNTKIIVHKKEAELVERIKNNPDILLQKFDKAEMDTLQTASNYIYKRKVKIDELQAKIDKLGDDPIQSVEKGKLQTEVSALAGLSPETVDIRLRSINSSISALQSNNSKLQATYIEAERKFKITSTGQRPSWLKRPSLWKNETPEMRSKRVAADLASKYDVPSNLDNTFFKADVKDSIKSGIDRNLKDAFDAKRDAEKLRRKAKKSGDPNDWKRYESKRDEYSQYQKEAKALTKLLTEDDKKKMQWNQDSYVRQLDIKMPPEQSAPFARTGQVYGTLGIQGLATQDLSFIPTFELIPKSYAEESQKTVNEPIVEQVVKTMPAEIQSQFTGTVSKIQQGLNLGSSQVMSSAQIARTRLDQLPRGVQLQELPTKLGQEIESKLIPRQVTRLLTVGGTVAASVPELPRVKAMSLPSVAPMKIPKQPIRRVVPPAALVIPPWISPGDPRKKIKQKKERWKKKKQWWEVPENWYEPGYWGGKDQMGSGFRVFSGKEPSYVKKQEKKRKLD